MKTILLLAHDDDGQEARLQAALDVTRALRGHLACLDVSVMPPITGDYYTDAGQVMLFQDEQVRESANRARLRQRLGHEDVNWSFSDAIGCAASCLNEAATLADLIVVSRRLDDFPLPDMAATAGELVVSSGKPILAVPQRAKGFVAAGHALVAWDGSVPAATALRAAVPLLALAQTVTVLTVGDAVPQASIEEAAAHLSRHDIHPILRRVPGRDAAAALLDAIEDGAVDYLVMGGFGHRRLRERLFGGVTRRMLEECPVPLIMAH